MHQKWKYYREKKQDFERYLILLDIKMSANSNKTELSEQFMVMWKEERPPELFFKKGVLRNFAKFTGKHLCLSLFFNKVAGPAKFLRTTSPTEHLRATASKAWKECRINLRFFQTDIFKCEIFFQLTPEILFVFKLAWHWLADTQRSNSCLCDVLPSYRMSYDIAMTWCVRCVGGIS